MIKDFENHHKMNKKFLFRGGDKHTKQPLPLSLHSLVVRQNNDRIKQAEKCSTLRRIDVFQH